MGLLRGCSGGWLGQMKEEVVSGLVKRAVLSPSYMKTAWARELENLRAFGLTTDQMLVASLDPTSRDCAFLAGSFNLPIIPGPDSMCASCVKGENKEREKDKA